MKASSLNNNILTKILVIVIIGLTYTSGLLAQTSFHNFGNVQIHDEGKIGFHTNLVNDGVFNQNKGFAGFYNLNGNLTVSGENRPVFHDLEVDVADDLELYVSVGVKNIMEYTTGRVITPRDDRSISLDYLNFDLYAGESDTEHTDGYVSVTGFEKFIFPIGDDMRLRPMIIPEQSGNTYFKGAYFYENPDTPTTFINSFLTSEKQTSLGNISNYEFWDLDGNTETLVTLTWDSKSNIELISNDMSFLTVVGWSETDNKWVDLGKTDIQGDFEKGTITSDLFIPNLYTVITIGSYGGEVGGMSSTYNKIITPNGDGKNDVLVFEDLDEFVKNKLSIFNRWGAMVYQAEGYKNNWSGISTNSSTVNPTDKLPVGTYFYVLDLKTKNNEDVVQKGWIYITR
ncbi:gliding motility-associated C-terminal domain-containing protein [Tenacibaculum sp. UWU-22]|uniref:gliding motility-associated C-terminal domain-containing protein n=1 Tax=Tenacibaculum sp. UWU-22 TaxID=3234187 RepID=UPI0034DB599B